jgi:signal transduction histidine kinase
MMRLFSIESGTETWRWRPISISSGLNEALMAKTLAIEGKHLQIEMTLADSLWDAYGDPEKISIVFNALLDNAVKFNREGGRLRILAANKEEFGLHYVHLLIHNDGQSIPEESALDIFEEYTQLGDINTEKPTGVGVGLAISRAIVERMRGRIRLEQPDGEGSSFSLLLPTENTFGVLCHE